MGGRVLGDLTSHLGLRTDEVVWFEHGPVGAGSLTGCGLDYAHLHVLPRSRFTFGQFVERVRASAYLAWEEGAADRACAGLPLDLSYMVAGCGERSICALQVEPAGSQFFRRVVADLSASGAGWDYRKTPHLDNVSETIAWFEQLENVSGRGA